MTQPFDAAGVLERLHGLDEAIGSTSTGLRHYELVLVGGSAISVQGLVDARYTTDIDMLQAPDELYGLLSLFDMNTDVNTFYYSYPSHWHDRIRPIPGFQGDVIDAYTLSPEDLAITKLLSWRPNDQRDLEEMWGNGSIDHNLLAAILDDPLEVRVNIDEDQWQELNQRLSILDGDGPTPAAEPADPATGPDPSPAPTMGIDL